jgi:hypothetical protein
MPEKGDTGWLTTQSVAKPVSAPNSLITGKNTGKFAKSGAICPSDSRVVQLNWAFPL